MTKIAVIVGTTRRGRQTAKQALWVKNALETREGVDVTTLDLKDYELPFFEEPVSPRYNPERTPEGVVKKWLDALTEADGYIVVTPEYNHSIPGVLKNALDYVDFQMNRKPSGIVSHGTVGGARAAMHLKEILSESKTLPVPEFVALAHMSDVIDEQGNLAEDVKANPYGPQGALDGMIDSLLWIADAFVDKRNSQRN
ncbi:MAG TPA: NADPH-dependent FMN reductase [Candidatus Saccharibacteria bacterium]|nr:NADPH-dependent FMN reductase [Candidatus Saccharibacteria bacterium]